MADSESNDDSNGVYIIRAFLGLDPRGHDHYLPRREDMSTAVCIVSLIANTVHQHAAAALSNSTISTASAAPAPRDITHDIAHDITSPGRLAERGFSLILFGGAAAGFRGTRGRPPGAKK